MYICIDFDGTIVDHAFPVIGKPVPGAIEWMKKFIMHGADLILWTVRCDNSEYGAVLTDAVNYLAHNNIELYDVNNNKAQKSFSTSAKAWGHIYIDDAAYGCPLIKINDFMRPCVDWSIVGPDVLSMLQK
jgi:hypothetical protein